MRIDFASVRERFPLVGYCRERGIRLRRSGPNWIGRCPIHQERNGWSFVVFEDRWTCFGKCGRHGDVVDLERALGGGTVQEAVLRLSGGPPPELPKPPPRTAPGPDSRPHWDWPRHLRPGTADELAQLAAERAVSLGACRLAQDRGLLSFLTHHEGTAWVISDRVRQNGIARRLYARAWESGAKAKMLPGSCGKRPIGTVEAMNFPGVAVVEGGPDFLAAFHFMLELGVERSVAPVCMASASAEFAPSELERLRGKKIRLFPHADGAGDKAARKWLSQLRKVTETVDLFDFSKFGAKDLNEMTGEAHPEAMANIGREPEY